GRLTVEAHEPDQQVKDAVVGLDLECLSYIVATPSHGRCAEHLAAMLDLNGLRPRIPPDNPPDDVQHVNAVLVPGVREVELEAEQLLQALRVELHVLDGVGLQTRSSETTWASGPSACARMISSICSPH